MRNIFFTLALLTLTACGGGESIEQHLTQARGYMAESDYPAATIELQNALRLDGTSAEARWLMGKVYLDTGNVLLAENELQQAQYLGWKADDIRPATAKTLLAQGKFADVLALEYQDLTPIAAALLLSRQALAAVSDNRVDQARELVALALRKAPQLLEAKLAEATIAVQQGDTANAMILIEAILQRAPASGEAWGLKGQALGQLGKLEDARAAFDQSVVHSSIAFVDRTARALISLQLQDYDAAQVDATELLRISPSDPAANYIQGMLYLQKRLYREAITALALAEPVAKQFPLVLYYLSMGYLIEKDLDAAEKFARQFVRQSPDDSRGRKLFAAILLRQKKIKEAEEMLQPVLDQNPDDIAALNMMGNALLLDDQADTGLELYARIAQLQPDWRFVPLRREAGLVTAGSVEEASPVSAIALDSSANFPQTDILLILNYLGKKDFQGAIDAAKSYHFRDLKSLAPYAVLGRVYLAAGMPEEAKVVFDKALKREPGNPSANQGLAQLALAGNDPDTARQYYQSILDDYPDDLTTLLYLTDLEAKEQNQAAMVAALKQAASANPKVLEPRLRLAEYYMGAGRPDKVVPLFAKLSALQQRSPRVQEMTALAQLGQQQYDSALVILQQLVDAKPESAQYRYLLALAASETRDKQKAKQELMEAIKLDPKHVAVLINLAEIAQREGEQGAFEQYLATLVELAPEDPGVLRLRALSARTNGNKVEALVLSQRAFQQAPTTQTVLAWAAFQAEAGRNGAAHNTLQQWVTKHPTDVAVRLALANVLERENNIGGAQAQYVAVLALNPANITALNNVAWNLRLDNTKQALETIRKATRIAPDQPDLLDTLAVIEHLGGDQASAHRAIQRALQGAPGNLTMRFHQAMIEAALGKKDQAIATLEELVVQDDGKFPERAAAKKLLATLKG